MMGIGYAVTDLLGRSKAWRARLFKFYLSKLNPVKGCFEASVRENCPWKPNNPFSTNLCLHRYLYLQYCSLNLNIFFLSDYPSLSHPLSLQLQCGGGTQRAPGAQQLHQSAPRWWGDSNGARCGQQHWGWHWAQPLSKFSWTILRNRDTGVYFKISWDFWASKMPFYCDVLEHFAY